MKNISELNNLINLSPNIKYYNYQEIIRKNQI